MNLSGELVLVRNELADGANRGVLGAVQAALQRMNAVTAGIQDAVTRSRMQGASTLFSRYQRTVRDLARDLGKEIELRVSGKETELDRSLIESLSDPLTHLVRNACDHGIELPELRRTTGKAERGIITLSAAHEAGQVVIEVTDDGKGIDATAVGAKAVSMGLVTQERLALMSPKEKLYLITLPGLSTAKQVSDLSGRGVGMDVVKANVDHLGGRIDIDSQPGQGSKVRITLPLTLSIIPALIAGVGDERFALPQAAAAELLHIRAGDVQRRIERVGDRPVLVLRGEVLPLVRLADAIGMERIFEDPETGEPQADRRQRVEDRRSSSSDSERIGLAKKVEKWDRSGEDRRFHATGDYRVIVVRASAFRYGVIVDKLFDTTEIVVKPLGKHLKNLKEYSGATILGDGTIALIIDPAGLALTAGLTAAGESRSVEEAEADQGVDESKGWLLFHNGEMEQCAMSLESVERVVRVDSSQIDSIGKDLFLRFDGGSLPVFPVASFTGLTPLSSADASACVICHASGHRFGFLASPPVDSVAAEADLDDRSIRRTGLMGTAVIQGKTTVVIDPQGALSVLKPEWFSKTGLPGKAPQAPRKEEAPREAGPPIIEPAKTDSEAPLLVVAEDSDFFRTMITEILGTAGYRVQAAGDGQEALEKIRDLGGEAALVVTDVEMPRMDGRALTQKIRKEFPDLPVIALTSLASEEDEKTLRNAGVQRYLVKLDRDELLGSIESILNAKERI
jgi:two-component system chemotaxis sensor kinase CheA